jgi:hypothetical protein
MRTDGASIRGWVVLALLVVGGALGGCQGGCCDSTLPPDLPEDPQPCTRYCKVWVPPVYRDVPRLCQVRPPCTRCVPDTQVRPHFETVCVKPRECYTCATPNRVCETAAVQTRPGGWKWKADSCDCWSYCYEPPCHQWCNKVVTEEGIEYCVERPPEYRTEVTWQTEQCERTEYVPGEYKVVWEKELYRPGYHEWVAQPGCECCACPSPCPTRPILRRPCGCTPALGGDCHRTN